MEKLHLKIIKNTHGVIEYSVLNQPENTRKKDDKDHTLTIAYLSNEELSLAVKSDSQPELTIYKTDSFRTRLIFFVQGSFTDHNNLVFKLMDSKTKLFLGVFNKKTYDQLKKQFKEERIDFRLTTNLFSVNSDIDSRF